MAVIYVWHCIHCEWGGWGEGEGQTKAEIEGWGGEVYEKGV